MQVLYRPAKLEVSRRVLTEHYVNLAGKELKRVFSSGCKHLTICCNVATAAANNGFISFVKTVPLIELLCSLNML